MLKHMFFAAFVAAFVFLPTITFAEDFGHHHDHAVQAQSNTLAQAQTAEANRLAACEEAKKPETARFSYWGYGHALAHCKGWIEQLSEKSGGGCCSGIYSGGECRLTSINMITRKAQIDGMWCPFGGDPVFIDGMGPYALVCAGSTTQEERANNQCPSVYCKGSSVAN